MLIPLFEDMKIGKVQWTKQVAAQLVTCQNTYDQALVDPPPTERLQEINDTRIGYLSTLNIAADNYITSIDALDVDLFSTANQQVIESAGTVADLGDMLRDFERDPASFGSVSDVIPTEVPALITECVVFGSFDEANTYYVAHPEAQPFLDPNFDGRAREIYFGIGSVSNSGSWSVAA